MLRSQQLPGLVDMCVPVRAIVGAVLLTFCVASPDLREMWLLEPITGCLWIMVQIKQERRAPAPGPVRSARCAASPERGATRQLAGPTPAAPA